MMRNNEDLISNDSVPVKADFSNLISQSNFTPRNERNYDQMSARYSLKDIQESKSIVDKFLGKEKPK